MKVFISYHREDNKYKEQLEKMLGEIDIKYFSVPTDYFFEGKNHEHIAQILRDEIKMCSVTICIIGKETYSRPHVDHELYNTLKGGICKRKGLVGVMLENRGDNINNIDYSSFPNRIQDNITEEIPYVVLAQWASVRTKLQEVISKANRKRCKSFEIDNTAILMQLRRGGYYDQ